MIRPMITTVTIDFWNTIVDAGNGEQRRAHRHAAMQRVCDELGRTWDPDAVDAAVRTATKVFEERWFGERRTMNASETLEVVWRELDLVVTPEQHERVRQAFEESILIGMPRLLEGAAEAIEVLAAQYRLALISDTAISPGVMLREVLARHGVARHFTTMVFSDESGVAKPHARAFELALEACGAAPHEAVHIGDIERTDIAGAVAMGMKAILFEGDPNRLHYSDPASTDAHARASAWREIPIIVAAMRDGEGARPGGRDGSDPSQ
jgi:FMN hydrolase / 5-amino-6-(5-phospho-D-ribitylamino)uracil phosphatase